MRVLRRIGQQALNAIYLVILSSLISGCVVGEDVVTSKQPGGPFVPVDSSILRTELDGRIDSTVVGATGSVWHVTLTDEKRQLDHWLVLYPDGRFVTSLRDERGWRDYEMNNGAIANSLRYVGDSIGNTLIVRPFGGEEEVAKQEAEFKSRRDEELKSLQAENTARMVVLESKDQAVLIKEIREICAPVRKFPKLGRFAFSEGMLRLNVLELHPVAGAGLVNYPTTGVSQLVFKPAESGSWVLDEDKSRGVWWAKYDVIDKLLRSDHLVLYSTRGKRVVLKKIEGFVAPPLPKDWEW